MTHDTQAASFDRRVKVCGWVGVVTLVAAVWTSAAGANRARHPLPEGVKSPVLALELIRSPQLLDHIAPPDEPAGAVTAPGRPRRERARLANAITIDTFAFIPAYATFLVLIGWLIRMKAERRAIRIVGVLVIALALAGAVFDLRENSAMLALLGGGVADPRSPSLVKWGLLSLALLFSVPLFIDRRVPLLHRSIGFAGVLLAVVSGTEGVLGALMGNDKLIEAAAGRLGATFLVAVMFLLGRAPLSEGLVPALNALARRWPFSKLVEWPSGDENQTVGGPVL